MPSIFAPSSWDFSIDRYVNPWLPPAPWKHVPRPISHFFGHRDNPQPRIGSIVLIFWSFIGVFCSILLIEAVGRQVPSFRDHKAPIIVGSFGAASVLEFYAIESPLSQPRNAVLGQILSSVVGIIISKLFTLAPSAQKLTWVAGSLSCACAVSVMGITGTVHPPAGATALLAVVDEDIAELGWFLLPVIILGCVLMQCMALLLNNIQRRFPNYWWTPEEVGQRWQQQQQDEVQTEGGDVTDKEGGARFERVRSYHIEGGNVREEPKILITKGIVHVPADMYITAEERIFLEELSERL